MASMRKILFILFILLVVFFYKNYYLASQSIGFHVDEWEGLDRGKYFYLFLDTNFTAPQWQSVNAYDEPLLGFYVYAAYFRLRGITSLHDYLNKYNFFQGRSDSLQPGWVAIHSSTQPLSELPIYIYDRIIPILLARKVAVFFSLLTVVVVFFSCVLVKNELLGFVCVSLLLLNNSYRLLTVQAMTEPPLLFFFSLTLYISLFLIKTQVGKRKMFLFLLLSIVAGLSISIKLNGIIMVMYVAIISVFIAQRNKTRTLSFFSALVVGYLIFYILNPYVWPNPLNKTINMVHHRIFTFHIQQDKYAAEALTTIPNRVSRVYQRLFFGSERYTTLSQLSHSIPLDYIMWTVGFVWIVRDYFVEKVRTIKNTTLAFILFNSFIGIITTLCIPLDWDRYYLPLILSLIYIQGYGIYKIGECVWIATQKLLHMKTVKNCV